MKILGIIPARGGSKGIPRKNIKLLGGKPLLEYTVNAAKNSELLSRVILSSEDAEIIEVAKKLNLEIPFVRPAEFSTDKASSLEVIKHALEYFEAENNYFDAVCLLQTTSPFREKNLIDRALQKFQDEDLDSLISVREVPAEYNPHWVFEEDKNHFLKIATGEKEIIPQRQQLRKAFYRDGALYITKTSVIQKQNSLYGKRIGYINTTASPYVNLDEPSDWLKAEEILKKLK